jgi:hypothetical protein
MVPKPQLYQVQLSRAMISIREVLHLKEIDQLIRNKPNSFMETTCNRDTALKCETQPRNSKLLQDLEIIKGIAV